MRKIFVIFSIILMMAACAFSQPDSLNMKIAGEWELPDTGFEILSFDIENSHLFVSECPSSPPWHRKRIRILDVTDPSSPTEDYTLELDSLGGFAFRVLGDYLYTICGWDFNLAILDVSQPDTPSVEYIGSIVMGISALCPYSDSSGNYLVCSCIADSTGAGGLRVVNVT
ncbi:hypothetical protein J7L68_01520, partial [bacterium]|nr:hypothetical protein [bacterium]